jgi:uridine nucleosidase
MLPTPCRKPITRCNAIKDMQEALLACPPNTAWLVATGALTNVALLFATFPDVATHIRGLSIMGGAIGHNFTNVPLGPSFTNSAGEEQARIGNHTPYAEFNIWCDPESAQCVFSNPVLQPKTVLIPLDVTHQAFATQEEQEMVLHGTFGRRTRPSNVRQMYHDLLMFFAKTYADVFGLKDGPPLHDPVAVAVLVHDCPDASTRIKFDDNNGERFDVQVELVGDETGRTKIKPAKSGIMIPRTLDLKHFWRVLNECLDMVDEKLAGEQ